MIAKPVIVIVIVIGMLRLRPAPNNRHPQAQRLNRVPDSHRFNLYVIMRKAFAKLPHRI